MTKIVFFVADDLELPITRSWYLFGPFVHSSPEMELKLAPTFTTISRPTPDGRRLTEKQFDRFTSRFEDLSDDIMSKVEEYYEYMFMNDKKIMEGIYRELTPTDYRGFYISGMQIREFLQPLISPRPLNGRGLFYDDYSTYLIEFQRSLSEFIDDVRVTDFLQRYLDLFDLMIIKLEYVHSDPKRLQTWRDTMGSLLNDFNSDIWRLPCSRILVKTIIGPRDKWIRRWGLSQVNKIPNYYLPIYIKQLHIITGTGLLPTDTEIEMQLKKTEKRCGLAAPLVRDLFEQVTSGGGED